MGWAIGSEILYAVLNSVDQYVPEHNKKQVYRKLIKIFQANDCETIDECFDSQRWPKFEETYDEMCSDGPED